MKQENSKFFHKTWIITKIMKKVWNFLVFLNILPFGGQNENASKLKGQKWTLVIL